MSNLKKLNVGNGILDQVNDCYYYSLEEIKEASEIAKTQLAYIEQYHDGNITINELIELCKTLPL